MANDNFKPTVDLREKMNNQPPKREPEPLPQPAPQPKKAEAKVLPKELEVEDKKEFQKINRPAGRPAGRRDWKALFMVMAVLLAAGSYYWFVYRPRAAAPKEQPAKWYMVKLSDGETFYGQIGDTKADPIVINNVYYDYDQLQKKESAQGGQAPRENPVSSIRLVKRGKETHGPDGTLNVVRSQVLYMEPLAVDSKVLKAIEEYEKANK